MELERAFELNREGTVQEVVMKGRERIFGTFGAAAAVFLLSACGAGPAETGGSPAGVLRAEKRAAESSATEVRTDPQRNIRPRAVEAWEDCVGLDLPTLQVKYVGGEWKIVDGPGGSHWAFGFGSEKAEAYKTLQILKSYRLAHSCFVTRPGPKMSYQLTAPGDAAVTRAHRVPGEDCISFNPDLVEAKWFPAPLQTWKIVQGNMWMLDFGLDQAGVFKALRVIKTKGFNQQCFVGRPGPSFTYWKILR